jgi:hypothetical protein
MSKTAIYVLAGILVAFLCLLAFPASETALSLLGVAAVAGLIYVLRSVDFSGESSVSNLSHDLSKSLNVKRRLNIPNWPITQAAVTSVTRKLGQPASVVSAHNYPDLIYVTFQYEIAGILYSNEFIAICNPHDRLFEEIALKAAGNESVSVRYDPNNPSDSLPADKTWHNWSIRDIWTTA